MRAMRAMRAVRAVARGRCAVVACIALACAIAVDAAAPAARPATHAVTIEATNFAPRALSVQRGDTVVWANKDPFPHTATAAGRFDSGSIAAGRSWKHRFDRPGDYGYICTFHPNMKATVHVE